MKLTDLAAALGMQQPDEQQVQTGYNGKPVVLKVVLDSKGRKGKTVTLVKGFQSTPSELEDLAQKLKKQCGTGGGVGDNTIELQGNHIATVTKRLKDLGYTVK
ncbi:MAG: translation initiation factor [Candidatus Kapaibacterium sp.]|nr:translation initiation factor [Bacteroidota bacterium]